MDTRYIQGLTIRPFPGLVNFVHAIAYHFCLNLPAAFFATWERPYSQALLPLYIDNLSN